MWEPYDPAVDERDAGWYLDDEEVGLPFLERVQACGPRVIAVHKGIYGLVPGAGPRASSPRDIGPAAKLFPEVTFLVYHSGYEPDFEGEEGPWEEAARDRGVNRLVASLADAGIPPGANVYAELGSTWFMMMRKPREAAHVLGKLLVAVGPDRILWGTDCVWYGSPQALIDAFRAFVIPERMQDEFGYPPLTAEVKERILSTNAAEPYGIDLDKARQAAQQDSRAWVNLARTEALSRLS
jgi:predicted TIM-barrel fold metal-dependent hydrolase